MVDKSKYLIVTKVLGLTEKEINRLPAEYRYVAALVAHGLLRFSAHRPQLLRALKPRLRRTTEVCVKEGQQDRLYLCELLEVVGMGYEEYTAQEIEKNQKAIKAVINSLRS
jgi:hypothetical protein